MTQEQLSVLQQDPRRVPPETFAGMTHSQKILKIMLTDRVENIPHSYIDGGNGNQIIRSGGFRPMYHYNWICSARDVELRKLRRIHLLPISDPPHVFDDAYYVNSQGRRVKYIIPQYRIELTPRQILALDWSRFWERPFDAIFDWDSMLIDHYIKREIPGLEPKPEQPVQIKPESDPNKQNIIIYEPGEKVTVDDRDSILYGEPLKVMFRRGDGQYHVQHMFTNEFENVPVAKLIRSKDFRKI